MTEVTAQDRMPEFKDKWHSYKTQDDQKHMLIQSLFEYIENLAGKLSDAETELRDKKDVIKLVRHDVEGLEKMNKELQLQRDRHVFALVLIDGDCMPFRDEFIMQGLDGGKRAASLLRQAVIEQLAHQDSPAPHHLQVVIRIYANLKGLDKVYRDLDLFSDGSSLDEFVRGFNMGCSTCDFVDAGNGKECSDEKIKANFRLSLSDTHCRHVFFGGSADNGYARMLEPYREDDVAKKKIFLLEGPPFAHELADMKDNFQVVSFADIFRTQKLSNVKRRISLTSSPTLSSANYATAAASGNGQTVIDVSKGHPKQAILRNKFGQRVDCMLNYLPKDFQTLKDRKLCNSYHLLGSCPFPKCIHKHGEPLSRPQFQALRAVARQSPCPAGLGCLDAECIFGHRCARPNCAEGNCRFSAEMHKVDTVIAK